MNDPKVKVPTPAPGDINSGLSDPSQDFMIRTLGIPGPLTKDCSEPNAALNAKCMTADKGWHDLPFKVRGLKKAVQSLGVVMGHVKDLHPEVYACLSTEGMLCVREIRGVPGHYSNHSWGCAIDLRCGELDQLGSTKCAKGLLDIYGIFHAEGWFWGAEFSRHDPMHMEVARETLTRWKAGGLI